MEYILKEGQGSLFVNKKKADKHPDMTGEVMINGKKMQISAWQKVSKNGNNFLSISIKEPFVPQNKVQSKTDAPWN